MKYGYARVSTDDQSTALQFAALKRARCKTLFKDEGLSGATTKRPAYAEGDGLATTKAIASASILRTVFSAAARRLAFLQHRARGHERASRTVAARIDRARVQPAAIADAKEPYSFFTCKITC
jgi:hypothetical protein